MELIFYHRISCRVFVYTCRPVPDPLPCNEYGHLCVEFQRNHLKRSCMPVSHQVSYQTCVFLDFLCPFSIAYSCSLDNRRIPTHVVYQSDKSVVQCLILSSENRLCFRHSHPFCLIGL